MSRATRLAAPRGRPRGDAAGGAPLLQSDPRSPRLASHGRVGGASEEARAWPGSRGHDIFTPWDLKPRDLLPFILTQDRVLTAVDFMEIQRNR